MPGLSVSGREENASSPKVYVLDLDPHEFADAASQFIDQTKHELVPVVGDCVEELPEFLKREIPYRLAKSLVFRSMFHI